MTIDDTIQKLDAFINNEPASFILAPQLRLSRLEEGVHLVLSGEQTSIDKKPLFSGLSTPSQTQYLIERINSAQLEQRFIEEQYAGFRLATGYLLHSMDYFLDIHEHIKTPFAKNILERKNRNLLKLYIPLIEQTEKFTQDYAVLEKSEKALSGDTVFNQYLQLKNELNEHLTSL